MKRIFQREYGNPEQKQKHAENPDQLNIAVTGLGRSTGSTTIATALAFYFAKNGKNTQFIQCLNPAETDGGSTMLYDAAAFDQRFANRTFHDVYEKIQKNEPVRGISNMENEINFFLPTPENRRLRIPFGEKEKARLIQCGRAEVCVFDVEATEEWEPYLLDMDLIIVVTDPLPSKMIQNAERFKRLKRMELSGCRVLWAVNKMNGGVSKREVKGYLKTSDILWIKYLPPEELYSDEFACRFHFQNEELRCYFLDIFTKISHTWLGL